MRIFTNPNKCIVNSRSERDTTVKLGETHLNYQWFLLTCKTVIDESVAEFL